MGLIPEGPILTRPSGEPLFSPLTEEEQQAGLIAAAESVDKSVEEITTTPEDFELDADTGSSVWESPTSAGIAEEGTGDSAMFDPDQTPGIDASGIALDEIQVPSLRDVGPDWLDEAAVVVIVLVVLIVLRPYADLGASVLG